MPLKKSAVLSIALAACSISLLVYSGTTMLPEETLPVKCCKKEKQSEFFSPWSSMSQSLLKLRA